MVIDVVPTPAANDASQNAITLRQTDNLHEKATAESGAARLGNARLPVEQAASAIALILVIVGMILMVTGSRLVGLVVGVIGFIGVFVLFFRRFTYRND